MDQKQIIKTLNWFYALELQQVDLYLTQSDKVEDMYLKKALQRIAVIEKQHAEKIKTAIEKRGGSISPVGDVLGPTMGKVMGTISGFTGPEYILKANIAIEEKAMKDYKDFILKTGHDEQLFEMLWSNLIDEDFHTAWFANKLVEYEKQKVKI